MFLSVPQIFRSPGGDADGPRCLHRQRAELTERDTALGEGTVFLLGGQEGGSPLNVACRYMDPQRLVRFSHSRVPGEGCRATRARAVVNLLTAINVSASVKIRENAMKQ